MLFWSWKTIVRLNIPKRYNPRTCPRDWYILSWNHWHGFLSWRTVLCHERPFSVLTSWKDELWSRKSIFYKDNHQFNVMKGNHQFNAVKDNHQFNVTKDILWSEKPSSVYCLEGQNQSWKTIVSSKSWRTIQFCSVLCRTIQNYHIWNVFGTHVNLVQSSKNNDVHLQIFLKLQFPSYLGLHCRCLHRFKI